MRMYSAALVKYVGSRCDYNGRHRFIHIARGGALIRHRGRQCFQGSSGVILEREFVRDRLTETSDAARSRGGVLRFSTHF